MKPSLLECGADSAPVTIIDTASASDVDAYVGAHPDASSYHQTVWLEVIRSAFGHDAKCLAAVTSRGIGGVLPLVFFKSRLFGRFAVSMPFLNYGGVLADSGDIERRLLNRAIEETRAAGASHLELRHRGQHFSELAAKRHKVAMLLRLDQPPTAPDVDRVEQQWNALDRKVRNQVRKAEKHALVVEHGGIELLPAFYEVFAHNMRDLGTPVYGAGFFREVLTRLAARSRVFVVRAGSRPVAASIVHWHRDTIEVPWASALRDFNHVSANVLLYWGMVRFAVERGCAVFDFGRSTPNEGTYHFKKQWGAEPRELVWEYWTPDARPLPELNPKNPKFSLAIRTWQRLPVSVATALGPRLVRNIP